MREENSIRHSVFEFYFEKQNTMLMLLLCYLVLKVLFEQYPYFWPQEKKEGVFEFENVFFGAR